MRTPSLRELPVPGNDPRLLPHAEALMRRVATALGFVDPHGKPAVDALRLIRSAAEGFIRLEAAGGFGEPTDVDASWAHLVGVISVAVVPGEPAFATASRGSV